MKPSPTNSPVEVRVPTYRRPELLERALRSLLKQTHREWKALVLDDSPDGEAGPVVDRFGDARIEYHRNAERLGRAANIDQAFQTGPLRGGEFAFVLEDDNWLLPDFIAENIRSLTINGGRILQRNQHMWLQGDVWGRFTGRTTRGDWFDKRRLSPLVINAHRFFTTGISNGGLFWRTDSRTNFQVGTEVEHASYQEHLRCWQMEEDILYEALPLCVFTCFCSRSRPKRNAHDSRTWSRGMQSMHMRLIERFGTAVIEEARRIAERRGFQRQLEQALVDCFVRDYPYAVLSPVDRYTRLAKASARFTLYRDPLQRYFDRRESRIDEGSDG